MRSHNKKPLITFIGNAFINLSTVVSAVINKSEELKFVYSETEISLSPTCKKKKSRQLTFSPGFLQLQQLNQYILYIRFQQCCICAQGGSRESFLIIFLVFTFISGCCCFWFTEVR